MSRTRLATQIWEATQTGSYTIRNSDKPGYQNGSRDLNRHVDEDDKLNNESLSSLGPCG